MCDGRGGNDDRRFCGLSERNTHNHGPQAWSLRSLRLSGVVHGHCEIATNRPFWPFPPWLRTERTGAIPRCLETQSACFITAPPSRARQARLPRPAILRGAAERRGETFKLGTSVGDGGEGRAGRESMRAERGAAT